MQDHLKFLGELNNKFVTLTDQNCIMCKNPLLLDNESQLLICRGGCMDNHWEIKIEKDFNIQQQKQQSQNQENYLLSGWKMLAQCCPKCQFPLYEKNQTIECANCKENKTQNLQIKNELQESDLKKKQQNMSLNIQGNSMGSVGATFLEDLKNQMIKETYMQYNNQALQYLKSQFDYLFEKNYFDKFKEQNSQIDCSQEAMRFNSAQKIQANNINLRPEANNERLGLIQKQQAQEKKDFQQFLQQMKSYYEIHLKVLLKGFPDLEQK